MQKTYTLDEVQKLVDKVERAYNCFDCHSGVGDDQVALHAVMTELYGLEAADRRFPILARKRGENLTK